MRRTTPALLTDLALLLAGPLAAYTIYFKDGRTLQTKGKHRVVNGRAIVTLLNGTQASFNPQEIDVKRTDEMNQTDLGAAEIIDTGARQAPGAPPPPRKEQRISDLINKNGAGPRDVPPARREAQPEGTATGRAGAGATTGGNCRSVLGRYFGRTISRLKICGPMISISKVRSSPIRSYRSGSRLTASGTISIVSATGRCANVSAGTCRGSLVAFARS